MPRLFELIGKSDSVTLNEVEMDVDAQFRYFGNDYPSLIRMSDGDQDWHFEDQDVVLKDGSVTARVFPDPEALTQFPETVEVGFWVSRPLELTDLA